MLKENKKGKNHIRGPREVFCQETLNGDLKDKQEFYQGRAEERGTQAQ